MAVAGSLIGGAMGAFGRKPVIPGLAPIDAGAVQTQTIQDNTSALPGIQALASATNAFNFEQVQGNFRKALEAIAPGQLAQVQKNTSALLRGEIPADVQASTLRNGAARSLALGAGARVGANLTLRDLGLTSLGLQQQGTANFSALAAMAPQAPIFNVASMFYTPQQRLEAATTERNAQFQRNLLAEQVAAAPDPATAALAREIDRFFNTAASIGVSAIPSSGG